MALPPIRSDQDAYSAWWLQPSGVDPGDALGYFGVASSGERDSLSRRGYKLLSEVSGGMDNPEEPLRIQPPTIKVCEDLLKELRKRVPDARRLWDELREEAAAEMTDAVLPSSERQIARMRMNAFRGKIVETYRLSPLSAKAKKEYKDDIADLESMSGNPDKLDDERRRARERARELTAMLEKIENLRPYTPAALRRYFLYGYRVQLENLVPRPHFEIQARLQQIAALRREEDEMTIQMQREIEDVEAELAQV